MAQYTRCVKLACAFHLIFFFDIGSIFADSTPMPFHKEVATSGDFFIWAYPLLAEMLLITVVVEYLVIYLMLGRPARAGIRLFGFVTLMNFITNPAAQLSILFIADPVLLGSDVLAYLVLCLIELVVIIIEFGLMIWMFGLMHRRGALLQPISASRTALISLVANIASFAIGRLGFIMLVMIFGIYPL